MFHSLLSTITGGVPHSFSIVMVY
ncbi:ACD_00350 [African swine fever virus]